ncbi:F5/8 type C domain protein [Mycobacterium xenopi 3993]|nr:F5/8 type C domain protein [Mycobacterium xenopi 3993]
MPTRFSGLDRWPAQRVELVVGRHRAADVAPSTSPVAAVDGDPATAWVSNALQAAVGQWLQVDFDHPVTNGVITLTPSATAVGAQIRRIQVATVNGTTTLRFDEPANRSPRRCPTAKHPGCGSPPSAPTTGPPVCNSPLPTCRSPSTTRRASRTRSRCVTPCWSRVRHRIRLSHNGIWVRSHWEDRAAPKRPTGCTARRRWH